MWLDIALCILLLGCIAGGYYSGFMQAFFRTAGWLLSIILAFGWYPVVSGILKEKTGLYDVLHENVSIHVESNASAATGDFLTGIPAVLKESADAAAESFSDSIASGLADLLFSIASVVLIILVIRFIFYLMSFLFSKKHNDGYIGLMDGISGAVLGAAKGILLILILLALFVPLRELADLPFLWNALDNSMLALRIYNSNPLLLYSVGLF